MPLLGKGIGKARIPLLGRPLGSRHQGQRCRSICWGEVGLLCVVLYHLRRPRHLQEMMMMARTSMPTLRTSLGRMRTC